MTAATRADPDDRIARWLDTDLDTWTRTVVRRHFDPVSGSPYWLGQAPRLDFDPRDITRYDQLGAFGPFPLDRLRHEDPADLVPLSVPRPLAGRVWDSGGTTGTPCRAFYTPDMLLHRAVWRRWSFVREGFAPGRTWLQATPTGPHLIGNGVREVSELHAGQVYAVDMDPRWVKRLIRAGRLAEVDDYTTHLLEQITDVLGQGRVHYLNTTPALLQALCRHRPELVAALDGVRLSGTQISADMYRTFTTALRGGICGLTYGNTFGNAACLDIKQDGELISYVPNYPQITMAVVDRGDLSTTVAPGTVGRVRLTVLHEDLFLPNILERDQALRHPTDHWPTDGVANIRPLQITNSSPEGLY
ncbi:arylcarboxylate reductase [Streptomyces sp. 196(2019)]|uniref:arylcarboxylate reductase n=1 Tax=Streptomyces sp. 196(2019) TaxID=2683820 RepID=UPI0013EA2BC5|nr:arylcarboxylate reductase [Streptomyces sp. 196(2019)]